MAHKLCKSPEIKNQQYANGGDGSFLSVAMRNFSRTVRSSAISRRIAVTSVEGNTIYKTDDGINKSKISEVKPLEKVFKRSIKIRK